MTSVTWLIVGLLSVACSGLAEWFPVVMESIPYPPVANAAQISGTVRLKVLLNGAGTVERSEVISGNKILADAAQRELRRWKFRAINAGDVKEPTAIEFTIEFRLEGLADGRPRATFRYEHPYRVTIVSEVRLWTP